VLFSFPVESEREAAAEHVMTIATAYILGASRSYPIMQLDLKENIQNATNGKVYVRLAPGGQLGAGGALVQKPSRAAPFRQRSIRCPTSRRLRRRRPDQSALFLRLQPALHQSGKRPTPGSRKSIRRSRQPASRPCSTS
jgi:hypothetical protein